MIGFRLAGEWMRLGFGMKVGVSSGGWLLERVARVDAPRGLAGADPDAEKVRLGFCDAVASV